MPFPVWKTSWRQARGDDNTRLALSNAYAMMEEYKKSIEILENLENKEDPSIQAALPRPMPVMESSSLMREIRRRQLHT